MNLKDEFFDQTEDFRLFAPEFLKIKDEMGNIIPFEFNDAQLKFLDLWDKTKKEGKKLWFIILKPRQLGFSTLIQALLFHHNLYNDNQKTLTMGHKLDASNNLFAIYERYYNHLPQHVKPQLDRSNEKKISYKKTGSENKVDTAQAGEIGRSDTYQGVHLTEVAFYPDPKTTLLGLMQGSKHAQIFILETTANGFNDFRNRWIDAKEGRNDFIPFFISWLEFPPYSKAFHDEKEKEEFRKSLGVNPIFNEYPDEEKILITQFGATLEQLKWRRWAIANLCNNDVKQFHQEYPATWEESFLASGSPVFNTQIVVKNQEKAKNEEFRQGNLIPVYNEKDKDYQKCIYEGKTSYYDLLPYLVSVKWEDNPKGYIKIYDKIDVDIKREKYVFASGCDVAEGLEQGDYSTFDVLDRRDMKVKLVFHSHLDPDLLADELHKVQVYLKNKIYFNIERNNHGLTTITSARKLGVNLYYQEDFEKGFLENTEKLGFRTTLQTKPIIINDLNSYIREALFTHPEVEFWGECLTFVKNAKGGMSAQNKDKDPGTKCFDDRVMRTALTIKCHKWMPTYYIKPIDNRPNWLKQYHKKKKAAENNFAAV